MPKNSRRPAPQQRTHRKKLRQTTETHHETGTMTIQHSTNPEIPTIEVQTTNKPSATPITADSKLSRRNITAGESTASLLYNPLLYKELKLITILGSIILSVLILLSFIVG
ncbi:hypothetical protein FIM02_01775 [SAR202 cluster bacterium AD-802-E10_MRT_200m]|nr:hypothetical protein [SAR202 cluster bacterium AD-802-E10_MRT_200m]